MDFYYQNHKGEILDLSKPPYILQELDFLNWEYEIGNEGKLVRNINGKPKKYKCKVAVVCEKSVFTQEQIQEKWNNAINRLHEITAVDVMNEKEGRLFTENGDYLSCKIVASEKIGWIITSHFVQVDLTIVTTQPFWITEQRICISPILKSDEAVQEDVKTYSYKYPYKYPLLQTETNRYIDHYTESDFMLTVHGPTPSVLINIAGHPYEVKYPLEAGERMVIDSRPYTPKEEKLYVVHVNGERENIFNYRSVENSVFKKIPAGTIKINYPRTYGIDLIIFKERSEPPWKSSP